MQDGRRPFTIELHEGSFRARALDEAGEWPVVEVAPTWNEVFNKCAARGFAYDGATEDALYKGQLGPSVGREAPTD